MPPVVIDVRAADDVRDVVHRAVQAVAEGKLVVFPTETVYGVAARALDGEAVDRLLKVKGRKANQPLTLAIKSAEEARDYAPDLSPLAERLARRCWPGPVTLVVDNSHPESLIKQLPGSVQQAAPRTMGLRASHQIILVVLRRLGRADQRQSERPARCSVPKRSRAGRRRGPVLDDGRSRFGQPPR